VTILSSSRLIPFFFNLLQLAKSELTGKLEEIGKENEELIDKLERGRGK